MKKNLIYICVCFLLMAISCQEEGREDLISKSGEAPGVINNINITPTPGGGIVTYDVPDEDNFLYVKAVYEAPKGEIREAKSSKYANEIVLECFGDTEPHNVKLYSVGRNTKESEFVEKSFTPLEASIYNVAASLDINAVFGGIEVLYENNDEANVIIEVMVDTIGTAKEYVPYDKYYTKLNSGRWVLRGFESVETNFAITVSDPCGNTTETIKTTLTPLFEIEIPKDDFADLRLPNDSRSLRSKNPITHLWDGVINSNSNFWASDQNQDPMPKWISLDFGKKYKLSRLKLWFRGDGEYTDGNYPTDWEVYGSNDPNPDGSWDSWTYLHHFGEPYKPSGLPHKQRTQEDIDYARQGIDYEFIDIPDGYRYYRIKFNETTGKGAFIIITEMTYWGKEE
ncbi:DUF5000 domain-containing lipoprotein [Wenyingzhuangia sp. chi5]|uniref:DUF5000 domain-containing lipoprotein n=1 Tax=Wenyingzhuangia gilva TaxID=3057677 RepID=A0ABT8VMR2_9FLAO|nr:DUF5000 domain-containing lipoprotein [Wenyingzhuangia sp. chi5]MDO3693262.1 DUF5000 domain-containing lipoprotein [Wenyingzhuangia sp. chi5]